MLHYTLKIWKIRKFDVESKSLENRQHLEIWMSSSKINRI
jgi:hypothetical protein